MFELGRNISENLTQPESVDLILLKYKEVLSAKQLDWNSIQALDQELHRQLCLFNCQHQEALFDTSHFISAIFAATKELEAIPELDNSLPGISILDFRDPLLIKDALCAACRELVVVPASHFTNLSAAEQAILLEHINQWKRHSPFNNIGLLEGMPTLPTPQEMRYLESEIRECFDRISFLPDSSFANLRSKLITCMLERIEISWQARQLPPTRICLLIEQTASQRTDFKDNFHKGHADQFRSLGILAGETTVYAYQTFRQTIEKGSSDSLFHEIISSYEKLFLLQNGELSADLTRSDYQLLISAFIKFLRHPIGLGEEALVRKSELGSHQFFTNYLNTTFEIPGQWLHRNPLDLRQARFGFTVDHK